MTDHTLDRILLTQMSLFFPLRVAINERYRLEVLYSHGQHELLFMYVQRDVHGGDVLDCVRRAKCLSTFTSPVLNGMTTFVSSYSRCAAYLAHTIGTWAKAFITFVDSLDEGVKMTLSPSHFLPAPSSSPFYLNHNRDFDKAVVAWLKLFEANIGGFDD